MSHYHSFCIALVLCLSFCGQFLETESLGVRGNQKILAWPASTVGRSDANASVSAQSNVPRLVNHEILNFNGSCTFSFKYIGPLDGMAFLFASKLVLSANKGSIHYEIPLASIKNVLQSPPGSFVVRSTREGMRCLYLYTSRATKASPAGPCTLCFQSTSERIRWMSEISFSRGLLQSLTDRHFVQGRLRPDIAKSFLLPPSGISTGRPFFAPTNNTICLDTKAQCLTANLANGSVALAALAWSNGFPAIQAIPSQRWRLYSADGGDGGDGIQICQPNPEFEDRQDLCLSAMRPPSDDFSGLPVDTPSSVKGETAAAKQAKLDAWRVFTSCEGGDYKCFVIDGQRIGRNSTLNDARVCQRACMLDSGCDGWTHTLAGVGNMRQGRCCLKKREDPTQPLACVNDECCTSGLKFRPEGGPLDTSVDGGALVDKAVESAGLIVSLAPRNTSSTKRWQIEEGGASEVSKGVRIVFVQAETEEQIPGQEEPLCLTLSEPSASGFKVGLLPCVDGAEPDDVLGMELLERQVWHVPSPAQ